MSGFERYRLFSLPVKPNRIGAFYKNLCNDHESYLTFSNRIKQVFFPLFSVEMVAFTHRLILILKRARCP